MIHLEADLSIEDLAILAVGGMIVLAVWVYLVCRIVEDFSKD